MTDRDALFRALLENPACDTVRLAFADEIEDAEPERAEFIRVQVELAQFDWRRCGGYYCQVYETGNVMHVDCRGEVLRLCQQERLAQPRAFVNWTPAFMHSGSIAGVRYETEGTIGFFGTGFDSATFSRGFIADLSCTTTAFLEHAEAIFRAHPVTSVRLTDREPANCSVRPDNSSEDQEEFAWCVSTNRHVASQPYGFLIPVQIGQYLPESAPKWVAYFRLFKSALAARSALSTACVAYGRALAGLPPLPEAPRP